MGATDLVSIGKQAGSRDLVLTQPFIAPYRVPVLQHLVRVVGWRLTVVAGRTPAAAGFGERSGHVPDIGTLIFGPVTPLLGGRLIWQRGVISQALRRGPALYWLCANPRDLSFWLALLVLFVRRRTVYCHGQGAYARPGGGRWYALAWRLLVGMSSAYIAYTPWSAASLTRLGVPPSKLRVADNTPALSVVIPVSAKKFDASGVLFVGRLRPGCELGLLIAAVALLRSELGADLALDVVGDGSLGAELRQRHHAEGWIRWHGAVYDETRVAEISRGCLVGCYPGDAGLSVLQFMALSLVPVVHDALDQHMGPEPSYIAHGKNGLLFAKSGGAAALSRALAVPFSDRGLARALGSAAWYTYQQLAYPTLGERLASIFDEELTAST